MTTYYNKVLPNRERQIELDVLYLLKEYYFLFGGNVRSLVIDLYLKPNVPELAQRELLMTLIQKPASEQFKEKKKAIELLKHVLPNLLKAADSPFGTTWFEALHAPLNKNWTAVSAAVVGQKAASDPDLLAIILTNLFRESMPGDSGEFNRCNLLAIEEAINSEGGNLVASLLLKIPIDTIIPSRIALLSTLLRNIGTQVDRKSQVNQDLKLALAQWVVPIVNQHPVELIRAIDALASSCPSVQQLLGQLLEQLLPNLPQNQANPIIKKLSTIPEQLEPYLQQTATSKESRSALLKLYQHQSEHDSSLAISNILNLCLDESRDVALDASWVILALAEQQKPINVHQLLPVLTKSKIVGVRQNSLNALIKAIDAGASLTEPEFLAVFDTLTNDSAPEVIQLLYKLVDCLIWNHPSGSPCISLALAEVAFNLTHKLVTQQSQTTIDMAAQSAFINLNQIANLEDVRLMPKIGECTRVLLRVTDISRKVDKLVITGLLSKLAKFNPDFLGQIVREDFVINNQVLPVANLCAIAMAIVHDQGKNAPLLDEILNNESLPDDVKSRILRERGL
jgi:hypothetical protein